MDITIIVITALYGIALVVLGIYFRKSLKPLMDFFKKKLTYNPVPVIPFENKVDLGNIKKQLKDVAPLERLQFIRVILGSDVRITLDVSERGFEIVSVNQIFYTNDKTDEEIRNMTG